MINLPEKVSGIRMTEVVAALRELEAGPYPVQDLYERYIEACRSAGYAGGFPGSFGQALGALGIEPRRYHPELGQSGRTIDPEILAEKWPDLPWFEN